MRRPRARGGRGAHPLGEQREDPGIEGVRLHQLARAPGEVPDLAGIGHHDGQTHGRAGSYRRPLEAARRFAYDERGRECLQPLDEIRHASVVVRGLPAFAAGPERDVQRGLGHIEADVH